jgi:hypothetical protein
VDGGGATENDDVFLGLKSGQSLNGMSVLRDDSEGSDCTLGSNYTFIRKKEDIEAILIYRSREVRFGVISCRWLRWAQNTPADSEENAT